MSPQENNQKIVLISGINGYIATNTAVQLLAKGYTVRGTSRSAAAKATLLEGAFKDHQSSYQHYEVADITQEGAFDDAVKGVHAVLHMASPVDFTFYKTVDEFMGPAVNGNISILNSALKHAGPGLKSFVLTSSIASVVDFFKPEDYTFSEEDWNEHGEELARKEFRAGPAYGASKAAAERALWKWQKAHSPAFSISATNPAVVTGPPVQWPATPDKLNETLKPTWQIYSGEAKTIPPGIGGQSYCDVRDVAKFHIWCMEHPAESNGQRYILANGKGTPQATADVLRRDFPDREIVLGNPGSDYVPGSYDWPAKGRKTPAYKAWRTMGVEDFGFIGYEKSILDTVKAFEERWPGLAKNIRN